MLQILGWMGCLYLVIKGLDIARNPTPNEAGDGEWTWPTQIAVVLCFLGAIVFFALIQLHVSVAQSSLPSLYQ